ncbi:hypothetical protein CQW23_33394 [Capsicum baccatum]|uniref:Zinc finger GRF-type domain-containing protein n=1 Tax=Capsicum baccatum TaxID=33114 RepID=A0A2G2V1W3_CAPBA|nr:hypothetical protein CQW23_33394 [Capsicum baccatum]
MQLVDFPDDAAWNIEDAGPLNLEYLEEGSDDDMDASIWVHQNIIRILLHLKTSWTSSNPGRRYWACPDYGGPRSCDFWRWRYSEDIDPRFKYVILKLIEKLGELKNVFESCRFNEVEKLIGLSKSIKEESEEDDKPKESKHDDNGINVKLEKEKEKNWRRIAEGRTRNNTHFFVVFFCCILVIALIYLVGMLYMKNGSMRLP